MKRTIHRTIKVLAPIAVTLSLLALPAGASAADFGRLKAWWPLNEGKGQTVYDWSGFGNHGRLGSTPGVDVNDPTWIKGIWYGAGLNFGGDDFIQIPRSAALEPAQFTISMWTRAPQSPGLFKYLLAKGSDQCVSATYGIGTGNNGGLQFYVWDGANQISSGGAQPQDIWDGRWHNVAATYNGSSTRLFLDGKDLGTSPASATGIKYPMPDASGTLGGYRGSCDLLFNGDLDQVMIFDKVLPITEIWSKWGYLLGKPTLG